MSDLLILATAAYIFHNAPSFRTITRKMILHHPTSFTTLACPEVEAVLDWRVLDPTASCVHKCGYTSAYAYAYMQLLGDHDLWPAKLSSQSLANVMAKVGMIPDPEPRERSAPCMYDYKHSRPEYRRHRAEALRQLEERAGLCLRCVGEGRDVVGCEGRC
ncbi:hypothetical protein NX059_007097 [Plenodomus lindquistii]|nr:hypothetical protein NX059_007097 [Plenodomus lindquistii]